MARQRSTSLPPPYSTSLLPAEVERIRDKYYFSTPTSKRSRTRSSSKIRAPRTRKYLDTTRDPERSLQEKNPSTDGNTPPQPVIPDILLNDTNPSAASVPTEDNHEKNSEGDHLQLVQDLFSTRCNLTKETFEQTVNSMSKISLDGCLTAENIHTKNFLKKGTVLAKREKLIAQCTHENNPLVRITDGTVDIVLRATLIANVRAELGILGADQTGDASECKKRLANLLKGSTKETSGNSKVTETQPESKNKDSDIDTKKALSPDTRKNIRFLAFDLTTDHVHVRESLTHTEINQVLDFHMGKELNFLRGDREAGSTALAKIVSNMLETEEDKEDTHVAFYFLNGECTGIRITHLDLSLEPDTIKSDVCILLGLDKHNSSGSGSTEPTIQLCDTLKAKWKAANTTATSLSHCTTQETRTWAMPITATPEGRETSSQNKDDAKELLEELVEANKEIQRQNNYIGPYAIQSRDTYLELEPSSSLA